MSTYRERREAQCIAELWRQVHKLGDARRAAHGYAPVLGDASFDDLLSDD